MSSADRTFTAGEGRLPTLRIRGATLDVVRGPDAGRSERLERPTFVVGTGEEADLRLSDGTVSREHLRFALSETGILVRDDGSKNGTWIGSVRVDQALLTADTTLDLGSTSLRLRIDPASMDLPMSARSTFGAAIGHSAPMRHLFALLERAAASDVTVLLEGESGVGKEVLARAVHAQSPRAARPFVAVDCGAIPAALMESELFGHTRGAFTGAHQRHDGVFEQANGGTLFLDEIGELPLDLQPKLLRVLEQREVRPLGGSGAVPVDVRIIAATNKKLSEAAQKNEFRRDLFYRLAVARVTVPPLRDRLEDVRPLANEFLRRATGSPDAVLAPDIAALLTSYPWPGNVRELRNVIERYALLGARDPRALFDESLPVSAAGDDLSHLEYPEARRVAIDRFEQIYAQRVLARAGGVVARAAELAGVARPTFYRMLDRARSGGKR